MWSTSYQKSTLPSPHLRNLLLEFVHNLNREVLSLELFSDTSKSHYRLGADNNQLTTLTANVMSGLITVRQFSFPTNLLYLLASSFLKKLLLIW